MSKECGCKKSSSGGETADLQNLVYEMRADLDQIKADTAFLACGHPILMLDHADDVESFDSSSGLGRDCWDGWALCNGEVQKTNKGKDYTTPNLLDKFVIGAGDSYQPGDTGGEAEHTLIVSEMPDHGHTLTDPGHTHAIIDNGHTHGTDQDPHTHGAVVDPHTHAFVTDSDGTHTHNVQVGNQGTGLRGGGDNNTATSGLSTFTTDGNGAHTHSGTTASSASTTEIQDASISITVQEAATGIEVVENTTGITAANSGGNEPHNNLPPFYAVVFVVKL